MPKKTNNAPKNPNIERDDLDDAAEDQDRKRKTNEVEERPNDRVRGREEGNKEAPPPPTADPAGGNL